MSLQIELRESERERERALIVSSSTRWTAGAPTRAPSVWLAPEGRSSGKHTSTD